MTDQVEQTLSSEDAGRASRPLLDATVAEVSGRATAWATTGAAQRRALVERALRDTRAVAARWNEAACRAKGFAPDSPEAGEELLAGIGMFVRLLTTYRDSLRDLERGRAPRFPGPVRHRPGQRVSVGVLPASLLDRVLFTGDRAEVWMEPGVDEVQLRATQAEAYQRPLEHAGLAAVLGAGNVAALAPKDVLHQLIVDGRVVILKANPVNEYLVEYWRAALAGFIEEGFVRIVTGGADVGEYLVRHPAVNHVHLTGAESTFNAVVFGPGEDGEARRRRGASRLSATVSAELGNVTPVIIVPGRWTRREIEYQAAHLATMLVNNAGFNCLTPRVVVTSRSWPQREEFLAAFEGCLRQLPPRRAYYPGAFARRDALVGAHQDVREIGRGFDEVMPWTIVRDLDPDSDDACFRVEAFCALTSETALDATGPADFLDRATTWCNDKVRGTLSATVLIDPRTRRRRDVAAALDRALADLRYGTIGLNIFHGMGIMTGSTPWGAFPGHTLDDIQSGVGWVGNAYMFARPQKSVVSGPFVAWPRPAWFATHRHAATTLRRFVDLQFTGSWWAVPALVWSALRD
jgi:acyl-CoA reductase-like NAD-dependent aldehyde dehydrogenase